VCWVCIVLKNKRSEFVEIINKKIEDLIPYHNNPRLNDEAVEYVKNSIKEFGFKVPMVIDKNNVIVAGHTRYKASKELGLKEVPCIIADDLTDEQIKAFRLADNKVSEKAEWDFELLDEELDDIDIDMTEFGFDLDLDDEEEQEIVEDEVPEVPDEPKAKLGDIYQLGNHRLMCGDSTSEEDVAKLMNGTKADMVFTDPPYGVDIKGKYTGKILNDNLKDDDLENFLKEVNNNIKNNCNGSYYICYEVLNSVENFNAFGKPDEIICFNKDSASFYSKNKYNRKYELIMYYENGKKLNCESETNVWDAPKSSSFNNRDENGLRFNENGNYCVAHPTTKPLIVPSRAIKNSSKENNTILDLFGGSGSTLIACEQLNRNCYMMELDPHYIDVIIQRWENFTGEKAVKING
jgi:site-specific DNA-methyltransferase (adenine-specific)